MYACMDVGVDVKRTYVTSPYLITSALLVHKGARQGVAASAGPTQGSFEMAAPLYAARRRLIDC